MIKDTIDETLVQRYEDLLALFEEACTPQGGLRIGAEMEKLGVLTASKCPPSYAGEQSIARVLDALMSQHGWSPVRESDKGPIVALQRGEASVTLEPGGQLELSGSPWEDLHSLADEMETHRQELMPLSEELGIAWLGLGFHPWASREAYTWVPKIRYEVMREYLPTRGTHGLDMMLRTATVQANYDYLSEADAMRKLRLGLKLAPITTALFANSPWVEGKRWGGVSFRAEVWQHVDPDRTGLLPSLWNPHATFATYVDWALDVPMFLFLREGRKVVNTGQTFRAFWHDGFQGYRATLTDWQTHLNTLFPEVRLKQTLEIRSADAQGAPLSCALPALWTGLLYDAQTLDAAEALTEEWTFEEVAHTLASVGRDGLRTRFRKGTLLPWAEKILLLAQQGLVRRNRRNAQLCDETIHLHPLIDLVARGLTPAEALLHAIPEQSSLVTALHDPFRA